MRIIDGPKNNIKKSLFQHRNGFALCAEKKGKEKKLSQPSRGLESFFFVFFFSHETLNKFMAVTAMNDKAQLIDGHR
jgi:hypothetical protein